MTVGRSVLARRRPLPAKAVGRYRALARAISRRRGMRDRRWVPLVGWLALLALGVVVLARVGSEVDIGANTLAGDVGAAVAEAFPAAAERLDIDRPVGTVQAEPVVDQLPSFTAQQQVLLQGHVPSFALGPERRVEVALNGFVVAKLQLDSAGRFAEALQLREGENTVVLTLLDRSTALASSSATTVFDRTPPALSLVRPVAGAALDGPTIVVEGKTQPGARVTVNDRVVVAGPDGSFSESFTAAAGSLEIKVTARDLAGNETTSRLAVTVNEVALPTTGQRLALSLDRTKVRPGEPVVADINVIENGHLKPNVLVTLQVGVVDIGMARTDKTGNAKIGFAAPTTEGEITVVVLGGTASARATLTVAQ